MRTSPGSWQRSDPDRHQVSSASVWVRRLANLNEFFVHHGGRAPSQRSWSPDELPRDGCAAMAQRQSRAMVPRSATTRRRARTPVGWDGHTVRARRGEPTVRIAGPPGELLLNLFGRPHAARVEVSGPTDAVKRRPACSVRHVHVREVLKTAWRRRHGDMTNIADQQ